MLEFDLDPDPMLPADTDDDVRTGPHPAFLPDAFVPHAVTDPVALNAPFDPDKLEWDLPGQTNMAPPRG